MDVHRKYGYDPAELFVNPEISFPMLKVVRKLIGKKLGFRTHMDLIPLDPYLVKGSHGATPKDEQDWPVLFGDGISQNDVPLPATEVRNRLIDLFSETFFT